MSWTQLSSERPVARKEHKCDWCAEKIKKGEQYYTYTGKYDGEFQSIKMHNECYEAMRREASEDKTGDYYFEYDINPRGKYLEE
jgi:hypothetical protein